MFAPRAAEDRSLVEIVRLRAICASLPADVIPLTGSQSVGLRVRAPRSVHGPSSKQPPSPRPRRLPSASGEPAVASWQRTRGRDDGRHPQSGADTKAVKG